MTRPLPTPYTPQGWCWYEVVPARIGYRVLAGYGIRANLRAWRLTLVGAHEEGQRMAARLEWARHRRPPYVPAREHLRDCRWPRRPCVCSVTVEMIEP